MGNKMFISNFLTMSTIFKKVIMLGMLLLIPGLYSFGQVSITKDNSLPHPSAMLEVKDTARGILAPRMTRAQRIAIVSPANGLLVYQSYYPPSDELEILFLL
jgi:hypothetical protein